MQEMIPSWSPDVAAGDMKKALQMPSAPTVWFDFLLNIFEIQSGCPKCSKTGPATKCFGYIHIHYIYIYIYNIQYIYLLACIGIRLMCVCIYIYIHIVHAPRSWSPQKPLKRYCEGRKCHWGWKHCVLSHTVPIYSTHIQLQYKLSHRSHTVTMLQSYMMLPMEDFVHGVPFWEDMDYMEVFRSPHLCR